MYKASELQRNGWNARTRYVTFDSLLQFCVFNNESILHYALVATTHKRKSPHSYCFIFRWSRKMMILIFVFYRKGGRRTFRTMKVRKWCVHWFDFLDCFVIEEIVLLLINSWQNRCSKYHVWVTTGADLWKNFKFSLLIENWTINTITILITPLSIHIHKPS